MLARRAADTSATSRSATAGTIGGAIAHADPASDLPALPARARLLELVLRSTRGERTVPLDGFFEGAFTTGIAPDEILVEIRRAARADERRRRVRRSSRSRRPGYAIVGVAAVVVGDGGSDRRTPGSR